MSHRASRIALTALLMFLLGKPAAAQTDDILSRAREAATSGRRPEALTLLQNHLVSSPRDVDARLLYGLVLSWEGRYDEARPAFQQVLEQAPGYTDARVALMNVEFWSGRTREARDAADAILARDPGNQVARTVRERLDASSRPWATSVSYSYDTFSDGRDPWQEVATSITRLTPVGSVIFRVSHTERFGYQDELFELEFYPRFRQGTYAFVGIGGAPDPTLYPESRVSFDVYQGLGHGYEVSGGMRRLGFASVTNIYVGTLTKYVGNWMLTGKVFHVPGEGPLDSTSYHGGFRRYFGGDGTSYVGMTYSHGFSTEEIRSVADFTTLDSDTIRVEVDRQLSKRLRLSATGSTSRQERQNRDTLRQTSLSGGFAVQF